MSANTPFHPQGFGWQPDPPDLRDLRSGDSEVGRLFEGVRPIGDRLPAVVDLREDFLGPDDQGRLHSSTAHACTALFEYFERRAEGRIVERSALFLYSVARRLAGCRGDCGVNLRNALRAMARFGVPPAQNCSLRAENFDDAPEGLLYGFRDDFRDLVYLRLDRRGEGGPDVLHRVKCHLAAGLPCVFGFSVPCSITQGGEIPFRPYERTVGGQVLVAVGYDDTQRFSSGFALIVRSAWGREWGEGGYGRLPYCYVETGLAADFWTILTPRWLTTGEFARPVS